MRAVVQAHFPFAGVNRVPGDVIDEVAWMACSPPVRKSMVDGGYVVLKPNEGEAGEGGMPSQDGQRIIAMIEAQTETLALLGDTLIDLSGTLNTLVKEVTALKMRSGKKTTA